MKKKNQILKLWGTTNPKTKKQWSKRAIANKVGCSRAYVYEIINQQTNGQIHSELP